MPPEEQQTQQQPAQQQAPQEAFSPEVAAEDAIGRAMGLNMPPRDNQGRFVAQQTEQKPAEQQAPAEQATQEQKPVDKPAEQQQAETADEEVKWDDVKNVKLKIPMKNGDKEWTDELTLDELRNQRMMHSDYMARRREMDEQVKTHETQTRAAVEKERHSYMAALEALQQSIVQAASPELANVDWNKLAAESPAEYVRLSNRAREVNQALERVRFEQDKVSTQQAKDRKEHLDKAVAESQTKLREAIPTWNDDLYQSLMKRGEGTYGFKPAEIREVWDHRVMQVLHDAHQFRMLKEQKSTTEKKVESVPNVLKPGNAKPKVNPQTSDFQKAKERLAANGNDRDAAEAVLAAFITPRGR